MEPAAPNRLRRLGLAQIAAWLVIVLPLLGVGADYIRTDWKPQGQGAEGLSGLFGALLLMTGVPLLVAGLWVGWKLRQGGRRLKPVALGLALALLVAGGVAALAVGIWVVNAARPLPWGTPLGVAVAAGLALTGAVNAGYVAFETFSRSGD